MKLIIHSFSWNAVDQLRTKMIEGPSGMTLSKHHQVDLEAFLGTEWWFLWNHLSLLMKGLDQTNLETKQTSMQWQHLHSTQLKIWILVTNCWDTSDIQEICWVSECLNVNQKLYWVDTPWLNLMYFQQSCVCVCVFFFVLFF